MTAKKEYLIWGGLFLVLASFAIYTRIWVTEDAYISFRYIENLFSGNGLVFNSGDRVEGFTHPLWLFLLILLRTVGIHAHQGGILLGFLLSLGGIALAIRWKSKSSSPLFLLPALLACHDGFRDFATSGLEFPLTFFLLITLLTLTFQQKLHSPFLLGTIVSLLYHTRPEMGMLIPYYFLWRLAEVRKLEWNWIFRYALAVGLFAGLYHLFRFVYFHDILPNTFYAKSGGSARYADGLNYLIHFLTYSKFFLLAVAASAAFALWRFFASKQQPETGDSHRAPLVMPWREIVLIVLLGHYIIRVGGDFMGFRLLMPTFIIVWFVLDYLAAALAKDLSPVFIRSLNLILFLSVSLVLVFGNGFPVLKRGIVNERMAYINEFDADGRIVKRLYSGPVDLASGVKHRWFVRGLEFRNLQACLDVSDFRITNSLTEAKCMEDGVGLGYFGVAAGPDVIIIDELGLTDRDVARSNKKSGQNRVGHERSISLDQVIEKKAAFCSLEDRRYDDLMRTKFGVLLRIEPDMLRSLGKAEYERRVKGLKQLKKSVVAGSSADDQRLLSKIEHLERTWQQKVEDLPDTVQETEEQRRTAGCWQ